MTYYALMNLVTDKSKRAKEPLKKLIWAKVSESTSEKLESLVKSDDRNISYLVRKFVEEGLERLESDKAA